MSGFWFRAHAPLPLTADEGRDTCSGASDPQCGKTDNFSCVLPALHLFGNLFLGPYYNPQITIRWKLLHNSSKSVDLYRLVCFSGFISAHCCNYSKGGFTFPLWRGPLTLIETWFISFLVLFKDYFLITNLKIAVHCQRDFLERPYNSLYQNMGVQTLIFCYITLHKASLMLWIFTHPQVSSLKKKKKNHSACCQ